MNNGLIGIGFLERIALVSVIDWRIQYNLTNHTKWVTSLVLLNNDKRMVSGSYDRTAIIWDYI